MVGIGEIEVNGVDFNKLDVGRDDEAVDNVLLADVGIGRIQQAEMI